MTNITSSKEVETWTTNQVVLATLFVVCVFLTFLLLYRLRVVIFLFFIAIVIGTAIRPAVEWLYNHGISRPMGIIGIYVLLACFVIGFLALAVPLIADQSTQLIQNLPHYYEDARQSMLGSGSHLLQNLGLRLPPRLGLFPGGNLTTEEMFAQVDQTIYFTNLVMRAILSTLAIFLLAFYWTQESNLAIRTLLRLVPDHRRTGLRKFIYLAELKLGGYIRGQGLLSLVVGFAAFIAYALIGLPFTLVLAIIAGLMEIIPVFGPVLGAIPAFLVALSIDSQTAIWVLIATAVIQMMENAWLIPRIMNHSMGVNPILIILSLVTFGSVLGFVGAVLAIPLAAIIQLILDRIVRSGRHTNGLPVVEGSLAILDGRKNWMASLKKASYPDGWFDGLAEQDRTELNKIIQNLNLLLEKLESEESVS